ncbi:hypothetical protein BSKO_13207 [Bryopsis sp. KO-2023]|nr:hypothetical protein BSKO_13207 [Bryopsis sp. KO-2023]
MGGESFKPKKTYRPAARLEVFYTGGPVKLSGDGKTLACACGDETKVVDVASGSVIKTCPGDEEAVTAMCFTPDDRILFSVSRSQTLRKWDLLEGECTRSWKVHRAAVADMMVDRTGSVLATGGADKLVSIWDVEGGYCTHNFKGHKSIVYKVLFHPSKPILFSGGEDSEVRVWNLEKDSCTAVLKGHMSAVTSLVISPDQSILLSGARDKVVVLWDIIKNVQLATVPVFEAIEGLVCLPCPKTLKKSKQSAKKPLVIFATGGERGFLKIWRSDTANSIAEQKKLAGAHDGGEITSLDIVSGQNGSVIMTSMADCTLAFWNYEVEEGGSSVVDQSRLLVGNNDEITDLEWVGPLENPTHICLATNSTHLRLFDTESLNCTASLAGHSDAVLCTASCRLEDGEASTLVVSGSKDNSIFVWEAPSGRCLAKGNSHTAAVSALAISKKRANFIATVGADRMIKLWDLESMLKGRSGRSSSDDEIFDLQVTAGTIAHSKDINSVAISPTDTLVCTGSQDKTAKIFALPDLVLEFTLAGHKRGIWSVEFSPVERQVLTGSNDKTIKLWSLVDGSCMRTFEGHSGAVMKVSFVSSGSQLISCGGDGLVKLWNMGSSECVNTFDEHEDRVWAVKFAGVSESKMITGGSDSVLTIWSDVTVEDEEAEATKTAQEMVKEQKLANALQAKDYEVASKLAFQLEQPRRLLAVLKKTCGSDSENEKVLSALVEKLEGAEIKKCLEYIRDWNTNSKNCHEAQFLLRAVLRSFSPEQITSVPGVSSIIDGLHAYTSRHFARIDRIIRSTFLLDYALANMNVLVPEQNILPQLDAEQPHRRNSAEAAQKGVLEELDLSGSEKSHVDDVRMEGVDEGEVSGREMEHENGGPEACERSEVEGGLKATKGLAGENEGEVENGGGAGVQKGKSPGRKSKKRKEGVDVRQGGRKESDHRVGSITKRQKKEKKNRIGGGGKVKK